MRAHIQQWTGVDPQAVDTACQRKALCTALGVTESPDPTASLQGVFNNQRHVCPSVSFNWSSKWGGHEVFVTGDFSSWAVSWHPVSRKVPIVAGLSDFQCLQGRALVWILTLLSVGRSSFLCGKTPSHTTSIFPAVYQYVPFLIPILFLSFRLLL